MMHLTDYHAKLIASELTRKCPSNSIEKLTAVLSDAQAQVDLNPHQVDAALFAFANPLSRGAILADEVGLGKTIEAGLLLAQMWAERKRRLLVIAPANLRKQWSQELADKFFLPSSILENKTFNEFLRAGNLNPFSQDAVVICSYQFARRMEPYLRQTQWDLVVIDEAHRLRNVYKPQNKIANAIKDALRPFKKVLLTATPLQNSLLELFGLVSIIDEYTFGDVAAFRARFTRLAENEDFHELKQRLAPICKRTLRKQVLEYVRYTDRHAIVQEFVPSVQEQQLYDLVSEYLQEESLYALPASQRKLMTLILRKLLASSTYAISSTLAGLASKLEQAERDGSTVDTAPDDIPENLEDYDELADEWEEGENDSSTPPKVMYSPEQLAEMRAERQKLQSFYELAQSITRNSKGDVLLTALRRGFSAANEVRERQGAAALQSKAIIFTESRRTQDYLLRILQETEFSGKVMLFNGTNNDASSKAIYQKWVTQHAGTDKISGSPAADMRQALVEYFRDEALIMIATEAAAEGINLQFCNLVVNYDLPWNPQRIEQRIGRCHRYGQKCDVVVVNFLNKNNAADKRVYELLDQKFKLFNGVFGASDEVLGAVESGVDFEKRIAAIYDRCRTPEQIALEFDALQQELDAEIGEGKRTAREKLLDNFDQEVVERVKCEAKGLLDRFNEQLWQVTRHVLDGHARFDSDQYSFYLTSNPFPGDTIYPGPYQLGRASDDTNTFRVGHPLAQRLLERAKDLPTPCVDLQFDYSSTRKRIAVVEHLVGRTGWLTAEKLAVTSLDEEEVIMLAGYVEGKAADAPESLDANQCRRLFDLPAIVLGMAEISGDSNPSLDEQLQFGQRHALDGIWSRNARWFDIEMEKLERWADDLKDGIEREIQDLSVEIKVLKREARQATSLEQKVLLQRDVKDKERRLRDKRKDRDEAQDQIEERKDQLIETIEARMAQEVVRTPLFTIRWSLK